MSGTSPKTALKHDISSK